jgi:hypothetical protein
VLPEQDDPPVDAVDKPPGITRRPPPTSARKTRRTRPKDPDLSAANDARSHATIRIRASGG